MTGKTMAGKTKRSGRAKGQAKSADMDRVRLRRFLYLWLPLICIVLIAFYAAALDPPKPTGKTVEVALIGNSETGKTPSASSIFRIRLASGEEAEVFIPEKKVPPPGGRIVVEEYTTWLLKKKTYRYLRTSGGPALPGVIDGTGDAGQPPV